MGDLRGEGGEGDDAPPEVTPSSPKLTAAARKLGVGLSDPPTPKTPPRARGKSLLATGLAARSRAKLLAKSPKRTFQHV
eukprot:12597153-Alexandrium_andersonii.AAC.1